MADLSNRSFFSSSHGLRTFVDVFVDLLFADVALSVHVWRDSGEDDVRGRHVVDSE